MPSIAFADHFYSWTQNGFTGNRVVVISDYDVAGGVKSNCAYGRDKHRVFPYTSTYPITRFQSLITGLDANRVILFREGDVDFYANEMSEWSKKEVESLYMGHELSHGLDNRRRYKEVAGKYNVGWRHFEEVRSDVNGVLYMWRSHNLSKEDLNRKIDQLIIRRSTEYDYTHLSSLALVVLKHKLHKIDKPILRSEDMENLATEVTRESVSGMWNWYVKEFMSEHGIQELNKHNTRGFIIPGSRVYSGAELMASAVWVTQKEGKETKFPLFFRLI